MLNRNLKKSPIRILQQFQRYIEADDSFNSKSDSGICLGRKFFFIIRV
jgi:hypothetical protein